MASVETDICNLALARVRGNEIGSLDESTVEAEKCRIFYPQARDSVLSLNEVSWPFAKKTAALALQVETPAEWCYGYAYPVDCLKALYIIPEIQDSIPRSMPSQGTRELPIINFEILSGEPDGNRIIGTNKEDAVLAYIKKVTDVRLFGSLCVETIAWKLAMDLAIPLGGDSGNRYRVEAVNGYTISKGEAAAAFKNQGQPKQVQQIPKSVQARN